MNPWLPIDHGADKEQDRIPLNPKLVPSSTASPDWTGGSGRANLCMLFAEPHIL